jgi:hypothetical protein
MMPGQVKDSTTYLATYSDYSAPTSTSLHWGVMFQVLKFTITNYHGKLSGTCSFLIENHYCVKDTDTKTLYAQGIISGTSDSSGKVDIMINISVDTTLFVDDHSTIPVPNGFDIIGIDTAYVNKHTNSKTTLTTVLTYTGTSYNVEYYDKKRNRENFIIGLLEDKKRILFPLGSLILSEFDRKP